MKKIFYYPAGIIFIIALWQLFSFLFTEAVTPPPLEVFINVFTLLSSKEIYIDLALTLLRSLLGFTAAACLGFFLGIAMGRVKSFERTFFLPVMLLQGLPPLLWIIPLILIFGRTGFSAVIFVFLVALPLIILNIEEGVRAIKKEKFEMFKVYADSKKLVFSYLFIPELSPYLKSSFFLGIILSLKSSILAEWFAAKDGVGRIINEYFYTFDMLSFYSVSLIYILTLAAVAVVSKKILNKIFAGKKSIITVNSFKGENIFTAQKTPAKLVFEGVTFSYGEKTILDEVDFRLDTAETILLTGESGAGKTTFAKTALGLLKPKSGLITIPTNGALIFQEDLFVDNIDIFANARLPGLWKKTEALDEKVKFYLEKCGLDNAFNLFPGELSGGMKKRLSFARALILEPDFLILDEPFANLHREARDELWDLYFELFAGKNIPSIIITHYPEELKDRKLKTFILEKGRIKPASRCKK